MIVIMVMRAKNRGPYIVVDVSDCVTLETTYRTSHVDACVSEQMH